MNEDEAIALVDKFFQTKPDLKNFIDSTHQFVEQNGFVATLHGHRRILRGIWGNRSEKSEASRQSVNTIK